MSGEPPEPNSVEYWRNRALAAESSLETLKGKTVRLRLAPSFPVSCRVVSIFSLSLFLVFTSVSVSHSRLFHFHYSQRTIRFSLSNSPLSATHPSCVSVLCSPVLPLPRSSHLRLFPILDSILSRAHVSLSSALTVTAQMLLAEKVVEQKGMLAYLHQQLVDTRSQLDRAKSALRQLVEARLLLGVSAGGSK